MSRDVDRVVIRSRFWPRFMRWAVTLQLLPAVLFGLSAVYEGVRGEWHPSIEFFVMWAVMSAELAIVALGLAARRWNTGAAEITPRGVRPLDPRNFHSWACLGTVRVKVGLFGNRWLEVCPDYSPVFKLAARPSDPDGVLEALEQFAGPDHPLTQAYFTLLDR